MLLQLSVSVGFLRVERTASAIETISLRFITDSLSVVVTQAVSIEEPVQGLIFFVFRSDGQVQKSFGFKSVASVIDFNDEWDGQQPQTVFAVGFNISIVMLKLIPDGEQKLVEAFIEQMHPGKEYFL